MPERANESCPACGTQVSPTGETVIGPGFAMRDFDTETATCPTCGLPLQRARGQPWIWAGDQPTWVHLAAQAERWNADAHLQWEKLRERFEEFGVRVEPTDADVTNIAAYGANPSFLAQRVDRGKDRPVLEALHRLCIQVAEAQRESQY